VGAAEGGTAHLANQARQTHIDSREIPAPRREPFLGAIRSVGEPHWNEEGGQSAGAAGVGME